ncbi:MAG: hypothetical protein WDN29_14830 [Methylovirgula sp.]
MILSVNGESVDSPRELARKIAALGPSANAALLVWHDGAQKSFDVKLGTLPNEQVAKADTDQDTGTDNLTAFASPWRPQTPFPARLLAASW